MNPPAKKIVVLISGSGSNLQAIIDAVAAGKIPATISCVLSNRADAHGLSRAAKAGIPTAVIKHQDYASREAFDQAMIAQIDQFQPDVLVLAGFMRILTDDFVHHYLGKMINIHPSLLPKFQGLNTHRRAIEAGEHEHGATVHFVTPELDGGPPILQAKVSITPTDSPESLADKVLIQEHIIYPTVVNWLARDMLSHTNGDIQLNGQSIPAGGLQLSTLPTELTLHG